MKKVNINIGAKLKYYRTMAHLSVEDLSNKLNEINLPTNIKTIYKWESNVLNPELRVLNQLAYLYDIPIGYFFEESNTCQALTDSELKFLTLIRENENYRKIIFLIIKKDKEDKRNGYTIIK